MRTLPNTRLRRPITGFVPLENYPKVIHKKRAIAARAPRARATLGTLRARTVYSTEHDREGALASYNAHARTSACVTGGYVDGTLA